MISLLSSSNANTFITSSANRASTLSAGSAVSSSNDDGISLDLAYVNSVLFGTQKFTENSTAGYLVGKLDTDIEANGSLSDVKNAIDTYTGSLASSRVYESSYSAPSASFLADLKALKSDAASNNLVAATSDLANAKVDAPQYAAGAQDAGDSSGLASVIVEETNDTADYLEAQGDTAVQAKAEANAITLAFTPALGLQSTLGEPPSDPTVASQISDVAASVANRNYTNPSTASDPMLNVIESLLKSAAISNSASLSTLSLLASAYGTDASSAATGSGTSDANSASETSVSSFA